MLSTIDLVVAALSNGHKIGLVTVAALFVGFALVSSLVLPRRNPDFPGKHLGLFIVVASSFLAMVAAAIVFGREPKASASGCLRHDDGAVDHDEAPATGPPDHDPLLDDAG